MSTPIFPRVIAPFIRLGAVVLAAAACLATPAAAATSIETRAAAPAPTAIRELEAPAFPGIRVRRIVFTSSTVTTPTGAVPTEVYAYLALPEGEGPFPAIVVIHGGKGKAEEEKARAWAARGYAAIAPELPDIADPATASPDSTGAWKAVPYGKGGRWNFLPDVTQSGVYEAVTAGLNAFKILQSQPEVDRSRIGIVGISWGGYTTTILTGLLGDQVAASFSVFGCGHYEKTTFAGALKTLPAEQRTTWMRELDAATYAPHITAPYFIAAPCNDSFFFPPAVMATLADIRSPKQWVFIPNADHKTAFPGGAQSGSKANWAAMEVDYFDHYLKRQGKPLPAVSVTHPSPDASNTVRFQVSSATPLQKVSVYTTTMEGPWKQKFWAESPATALGNGAYEAVLPGEVVQRGFWFAMATDERPVSVSSLIYACGDADVTTAP